MSNLEKHAEFEMKRAGLYDGDSDYNGSIPQCVMKLVKVHAEERHSGGSHAIVLSVFNKVVNFRTLSPITSDPSEWMRVADIGTHEPTGLWQNSRCPSFFSRDEGKTWYDIDARAEVAP